MSYNYINFKSNIKFIYNFIKELGGLLMINVFVDKVKKFMMKPTYEKRMEIEELFNKIIIDEYISSENKESAKTVYSYVQWVTGS